MGNRILNISLIIAWVLGVLALAAMTPFFIISYIVWDFGVISAFDKWSEFTIGKIQ